MRLFSKRLFKEGYTTYNRDGDTCYFTKEIDTDSMYPLIIKNEHEEYTCAVLGEYVGVYRSTHIKRSEYILDPFDVIGHSYATI